MELLIDIGNTRAKYCFVINNALSDVQHLSLNDLNRDWMNKHWSAISKLVVASVNEERYTQLINAWAQERKITFRQVATEQSNFGVTNGYRDYRQLGIDRWLALVAAVEHYPNQSLIVVDAGTATTIDIIDEQGTHLGGWILAGIDTLISSIVDNTANLAVEMSPIESLTFGVTTSDNLNIAPWAATLGLIEQAVNLFQTSHMNQATEPKIVVTGGNGQVLHDLLTRPSEYFQQLVFEGLKRYLAD